MEIFIDESDGQKKYIINNIEYTRIEDIPEEFRQTIDQMNADSHLMSLLDKIKTKRNPADVLDVLFEQDESEKRDARFNLQAASNNKTAWPMWMKLYILLCIGLLIVSIYLIFFSDKF